MEAPSDPADPAAEGPFNSPLEESVTPSSDGGGQFDFLKAE